MKKHGERAHSKFSASGAERWFNCPGSVELSEGQPDKSSPWALEGTKAHEVLEMILRALMAGPTLVGTLFLNDREVNKQMIQHGHDAANFILGLWRMLSGAELWVETRVFLDWLHPDAFGTLDSAVVDLFGTLHIFDYKYGQGHAVSPKENLQMIFYALAAAYKFKWNFKRIRIWIIQPRIKGYDGPMFWEIPTLELMKYIPKFKEAIDRVEENPREYVEGSWCHWCKAKAACPLKQEAKLEKAKLIFSPVLPGREYGSKKESREAEEAESGTEESKNQKSEADWKKEAREKKKRKNKNHGAALQRYISRREQADFY